MIKKKLVIKKLKYPKFLLIKIKKNFTYWTVWLFSPDKTIKKKLEVYSITLNQNNLILFYKDIDTANRLFNTHKSVMENLFLGIVQEYSKSLEVFGVGYTIEILNNTMIFNIGYSHKITYSIPNFLTFSHKKKQFEIKGSDLQKVMQVSNLIKRFKKVDPYKGKGVRFQGEQLFLKATKVSK